MNSLRVDKYLPKHPFLKKLIKYFWVLKSDHPTTLNHKLLPVNNIDFILNFSSPIKYCSESKVEETPKYFFSGIRHQYCINHQVGKLNMLGISFFPAGLYPFLKIPLSEFTNRVVELDLVIHKFSSALEERLCFADSVIQQIEILENYLIRLIDPRYIPANETFQMVNTFYSVDLDIRTFCKQYGVNQRKLERIFNEYIGISPKYFKRLNRFQGVINQILNKKYIDFTSMAYENDYYDQAHFIKDFKSFAGCSPSQFVKEKKSIKEILTYWHNVDLLQYMKTGSE
ncbi:MAG: AraC family transcriptional regulator [Desulfobulbaceae bacterium]|nr:AraC family transcriptional regulator [Desulfobulbaceae bacterium]